MVDVVVVPSYSVKDVIVLVDVALDVVDETVVEVDVNVVDVDVVS